MASEKITNILEEIKTLTILELADLVKAVEEEFGVSAAAPVGVVAVAGAAAAPAAEEKTEFDVVLASAGDQKLKVVKVVKEAVSKETAEGYVKQLTEAGAKAELK